VRVDPWPTVDVGTTDRTITASGGAVLLRDVMSALGVVGGIDECLGLKVRARGLSEGEFIAAMAEAVALGADCLDDLAVARADRAQESLRGYAVPAPQTAGTFLRRFTRGHIRQLDKALEAITARAWRLSGVASVTLDFDSTYIFSRSKRRQGADRTYKKGYALHPLVCFDAETGAAVHARLRRGRVATNNGIVTFLAETLRRVPAGVAVRARVDSGFYSGALFEQMERAGVTYTCSVPFISQIAEAVRAISEPCWAPCVDKDEGEVAEFGYRLSSGRVFRRYVVKRILIAPGEQASLEAGGYRYWVLVTNDHTSSAVALESEHRHKADVESGMRELKSNFGLSVLRKHGFMANWAWLLIVCLGHNLCAWLQNLGKLVPAQGGRRLRAKRLRYRYLTLAAMVVHSGRRLILRLTAGYPYLRDFLAVRRRLERLAKVV
jgi:hypothetical protein